MLPGTSAVYTRDSSASRCDHAPERRVLLLGKVTRQLDALRPDRLGFLIRADRETWTAGQMRQS
ncbi:MAG TPA: hypothetical protein VFW09_17855 [Solirubrobacteraceae bacterium]|nr:hypothetical protein [Solirubrobacteraceae bacterium]